MTAKPLINSNNSDRNTSCIDKNEVNVSIEQKPTLEWIRCEIQINGKWWQCDIQHVRKITRDKINFVSCNRYKLIKMMNYRVVSHSFWQRLQANVNQVTVPRTPGSNWHNGFSQLLPRAIYKSNDTRRSRHAALLYTTLDEVVSITRPTVLSPRENPGVLI